MIDLASVLGTLVAFVGILGGQLLEGGRVHQLIQSAAAMIVFGGTFGAVLLSFPVPDLVSAVIHIPTVYMQLTLDLQPKIEEIIRIASIARRDGVIALESELETIQNEFLKRSVKNVVEGFEPNTVREILDAEIELEVEKIEAAARVFEGAGGYAPTIGIIGAVLGLIHVMSTLNEDPTKIGDGIAVAFVATVYGVGAANLVFIPWGTKLRRKAAQKAISSEVVKLGVLGIQDGLNPYFLRHKLEVFVEHRTLESRSR